MRSRVSRPWSQELAAAVRRQRKSLRLTQHQLGELAGCGPVFLYSLESGKPSLRLDKLVEVLRVLGLDLRVERGHSGLRVAESLK